MIVVITAAAEADLESIGDWIATRNPARAITFIQELRLRCHRLVDAPEGYALVPQYEANRVRRRPYGNYLIFYRINDNRIEILHVLHGARDYEPILFPDD